MNPTLEVQITAKLDQLDAGLKVAEAKISKSAVTMGKVGEKAGANFGATFAANLPMMMVATAIAHTVGNGILQAVKDVTQAKAEKKSDLVWRKELLTAQNHCQSSALFLKSLMSWSTVRPVTLKNSTRR